MNRSFGFQFLLLLTVKWGVLLVPSLSISQNEVSALAAFKRGIFEDPFSVLSDWNSVDGNPCNWTRVICSENQDSLLSLNLSGSSLKGFLSPELGSLSSLQELYLANNLLLGTLPKQIGMLKKLTILDLSVNRFTGPIPPEFGDLTSIVKIDLHSNGLTGYIPPELGQLKNLVELRLDRNRLRGSIPANGKSSFSPATDSMFAPGNTGLCQAQHLRIGDFSYNFFIGKIPPCLKYLPRSSFQGNCFDDKYSIMQRTSQLCRGGAPKRHGLTAATYREPNEVHKHQSLQQPEWLLILEITTGVLVVIFFITGIATAVRSCKRKASVRISLKRNPTWKDQNPVSIDGELLKDVPRFTREELEIACEDFSNIIGSSSESIVFKGTIKDGPEIAVISLCILQDNWTSYLEFLFQNKVADFSRLNHENVAKLLGYCKECDPLSRMFVFEYASNGTLYEYLHYGEGFQLSWLRRLKIILGIARALKYLHIDLQPSFAISELNSNAVHLTEDFSPKLVDFESFKVPFPKYEKNLSFTNGSSFDSFHGCMDSHEQQDMDIQTNIYAFGVLVLEIISGRPPYCKDQGCLVKWAMQHLEHPDEIGKLVDPELKNVRQDDLAVLCSVIGLCIEPDPSKRPSMQIISAVLENGIDLSAAAFLKESSLAWAELALSS